MSARASFTNCPTCGNAPTPLDRLNTALLHLFPAEHRPLERAVPRLFFTGFKVSYKDGFLWFQWIYYHADDGPFFCACSPGDARQYAPGQTFDPTQAPGQECLTVDDLALDHEELTLKAQRVVLLERQRLIDFVKTQGIDIEAVLGAAAPTEAQ